MNEHQGSDRESAVVKNAIEKKIDPPTADEARNIHIYIYVYAICHLAIFQLFLQTVVNCIKMSFRHTG